MRSTAEKRRVMLLVSKSDHCLVDLLYRRRIGELQMDISAIVANHPRETYSHIDLEDLPFHYLPVTKQTKLEQEQQIWDLVKSSQSEVVVLARQPERTCDVGGLAQGRRVVAGWLAENAVAGRVDAARAR